MPRRGAFLDGEQLMGDHRRVFTMGACTLWIQSGIMNNWLVVWNMAFMTSRILGISSPQLTNSYFSEGQVNHQPDNKDLRLIAMGILQKRENPSNANISFEVKHGNTLPRNAVWQGESICNQV